MNKINYLNILCCPFDKSDLKILKNNLICQKCRRNYKMIDGIISMISDLKAETLLSAKKWDEFYKKEQKIDLYEKEFKKYLNLHYKDVYKQVNSERKISKIDYLEIGCGPFFFGQKIAKKCRLIVGVDFSLTALLIAKKMLKKRGIKNYLLIHGDILNLPIKNNIFDLIYGGGVIEHFINTQLCIDELYRVLKKGGVSFNTVPYLNLGSLTYRQIWGNIPNAPILKPLAEFMHIKLLRSKHMIFGYEFSFLGSTLKKIHKKAGFKTINVEKFDVELVFDFIPGLLRRPFSFLAKKSRLFWPMVKVIGIK